VGCSGWQLVADLRRTSLLLGRGWPGGSGNQAAAADVALQQGWFAAYNLAAGCPGILGALVALGLAKRWGSRRARRWLLGAATAACSVLLLRGLLGLTLLGVGLLTGTFDQQTPAVLLAIEPWFVVGGIAYGALVVDSAGCPRPTPHLTDRSPFAADHLPAAHALVALDRVLAVR